MNYAPLRSDLHTSSMKHLVGVAQDLSHCRSLDAVTDVVRIAARELTGADGATFVLRDGNFCHYIDENAIGPLWKGQRFPLQMCISGWVMLQAHPAIIEDIYQDSRIPIDAYNSTFVKSLTMVPIRKQNPLGAIGTYWAYSHHSDAEELSLLQALANITSIAIENADLYMKLQEKIKALENTNNELRRFSSIVSNDLKSPLQAIENLSTWIEEGITDKRYDESTDHLKLLRARVGRMEKFLEDVHEYARLDRNHTAPQPLVMAHGIDILEALIKTLEIPACFKIETRGDFNDLPMPRMPLLQIFSNLVRNCIQHHHLDHGTITIDVEKNKTHYTFKVSDDGPGIPLTQRHKIDQVFCSQKQDLNASTGLGLKLVKRILDAYGGAIYLKPHPGRGSTFIFTWPVAA